MTEPVDSNRQSKDHPEYESPEDVPVIQADEDAAIPMPDGIGESGNPESSMPDDLALEDASGTVSTVDGSVEAEQVLPLEAPSDDDVDVTKTTVDKQVPVDGDVTSAPLAEEALTTPSSASPAGSRFGRLFGKNKPKGDNSNSSTGNAQNEEITKTSTGAQMLQRFRDYLDPGIGHVDLTWARRMVGAVLVLILVLLAANQAGAALIVGSAVIPALVVMLLTRYDVFERESNLILAGLGVAGVVGGVVLGALISWVVGSQWFNGGHLNFGAGGFGGNFASEPAPLLVWLVAGLLTPTAIVAGTAAAPILLRRKPQFANEVMDGVTLAASSAAGIAIGLAATFWFPMINGDGPLMSVSDWTLMIMGQVLLRPLVITLSGAMIGAGVWRYMLTSSSGMTALMPTVAGVLGIFLLWLGSIATQTSGIWAEFQMTLLLALLVFVLYRHTLVQAIQTDSLAMGHDGERIVCPHCQQVTPVGTFCARCGQPLDP